MTKRLGNENVTIPDDPTLAVETTTEQDRALGQRRFRHASGLSTIEKVPPKEEPADGTESG